MELKIANKESENLNEYLEISATRVVEISADMAKEIYHYLAKVQFGMKVNHDFSNLDNDLLRKILVYANNVEEAVFVATIFNRLLVEAKTIDLSKIHQEQLDYLSKHN